MIKEILIKNVATYNETGVKLENLRKVNFIYGTNGSGKTTLSNLLMDPESFSDCEIVWETQPMVTLVYNRKFVEENFRESSKIKGIFTLGKESAEIRQEIESKKETIEKINKDIHMLKNTLIEKQDEKLRLEEEFIESCWKQKTKYDVIFERAFRGTRNNKKLFRDKCFEAFSSKGEVHDFNTLKERAEKLFKSSPTKIEKIDKINPDSLKSACQNPIFSKIIIGKQELDIAKLINKLGISDWVREGYRHLQETEGICPFCQQHLPGDFEKKLNEYFDETFDLDLRELEKAIAEYQQAYAAIELRIKNLLVLETQYLNKSVLQQQFELITSNHMMNLELISGKKKEVSRKVILHTFEDEINKINEQIDRANYQIEEFNRLIENRIEEEKKLIKDIWSFIADQLNETHDWYVRQKITIEKAENSIKEKLYEKADEKKKIEEEILDLEKQITSIIPTIEAMNRMLKTYNFTNFEFREQDGYYKLVRLTGEDVGQTLSEGEKTFVTFLYFMHLLNGSNEIDLITQNKVVVIDDPISSLDSSILYVVSNLIKNIIEDIREGKGNLKQLFILTHNVYFFKEITFCPKRSKLDRFSYETFWILRKINGISEIKSYEEVPVQTSYELLWKELREVGERSAVLVQNITRRILEYYFKVWGGIEISELSKHLDSEEKVIFDSMISWSHDGSHYVYDEIFVEEPSEMARKYLQILEKVFINSGHYGHYKMMMGLSDDSLETRTEPVSITA